MTDWKRLYDLIVFITRPCELLIEYSELGNEFLILLALRLRELWVYSAVWNFVPHDQGPVSLKVLLVAKARANMEQNYAALENQTLYLLKELN